MSDRKIITRFPPSPTGWLHIGNARTALFNYLFAKHAGGTMRLRIEDTDRERSKPEYLEDIIKNLHWLRFDLDYEHIPKQTERQDVYRLYLERLIESGFAYVSKETPARAGDREEVIRFKNPNKIITFTDLIRGEITFDTTELGDFVIAKSLDEPVYHLTVVVDDFEMGITHVIRGEDHISNTPRQILIGEAIGAPRPFYAHLPLLLGADRSKLSKRQSGEAVSVSYYRQQGYQPEAFINFLALLGWNPGGDREIFSLDELVAKFDIGCVGKSGAIFNVEKLNHLNREYLKKLPKTLVYKEVAARVMARIPTAPPETIGRSLALILERINCWGDIDQGLESGEFAYLYQISVYDKALLKDAKYLGQVIKLLEQISGEFTKEKIKDAIWAYATERGRGEVLWPLRVALSGQTKSPDPFTLAEVLGQKETINRLKHAQEL